MKFFKIIVFQAFSNLLSPHTQIEWLDNYHQTCREIVGNALKKQGKTAGFKWLMKETEPLG